MGHRITWRNRPRHDYPWPIETDLVTTIPTLYPMRLPLHALSEFVYRVRAFRYTAEVSGIKVHPVTSEETSFTRTETGIAYLAKTSQFDPEPEDASVPDEIDVWKKLRPTRFDGEDAYPACYIWQHDTTDSRCIIEPFRSNSIDEDTVTNAVYIYAIESDGVKEFTPLHYFFIDLKANSTSPRFFFEGHLINRLSTDTDIQIELRLQSGTHSFDGKVRGQIVLVKSISSASLVIEAVEWHPYATKDGSPAWDESTGEVANGGPGA